MEYNVKEDVKIQNQQLHLYVCRNASKPSSFFMNGTAGTRQTFLKKAQDNGTGVEQDFHTLSLKMALPLIFSQYLATLYFVTLYYVF